MIEINGKEYPLWSKFVEGKERWIGGILEDLDNDPILGDIPDEERRGIITDIKLEPNGETHAFFSVVSGNVSCGFSTDIGGVIGGDEGWITFCGYGGHTWRIKEPNK